MRHGTSSILILLLAAVLAFTASPALAQPQTSCEFDPITESVIFSVTGGDPVQYTMHIEASGCVELANPGDSVIAKVGPAFVHSVKVKTAGPTSGTGTVEVLFCLNDACFDTCEEIIPCSVLFVPSVTGWGFLVLLALLLASGAYLVRRRRAVAVR